MILSGLLLIPPRTEREDVATRLLRDYARWEYRGDREWFLTRLSRAPRRRPFERLRTWLRRALLPKVLPEVEEPSACVGR